ncbi:MAG: MerR family DNA-binding transcriptional regulator [Cohnella sp.]|nr:MerR family DNA-binding transcriptional regulator [Cohnella sp.]
MKEHEAFTTGQLARRTGLTLRTLRYYDTIGLLTPRKQQAGGARWYGLEHTKLVIGSIGRAST